MVITYHLCLTLRQKQSIVNYIARNMSYKSCQCKWVSLTLTYEGNVGTIFKL